MKIIPSTSQGFVRAVKWVLGLAVLAVLVFGQTASTQAVAPDLIVDQARLQSSVEIRTQKFQPWHCAVQEGCTTSEGKRTLLRFDVAIANIGTGDFVLGSPTNDALFEDSPCHGHRHLKNFVSYELRTAGGLVVLGQKQAFCLLDSAKYLINAGLSNGYNCSYQGITAGWQDIYSKSLDCQWIDITHVPPGQYTLSVRINPLNISGESNPGNNEALATITIPITKGNH